MKYNNSPHYESASKTTTNNYTNQHVYQEYPSNLNYTYNYTIKENQLEEEEIRVKSSIVALILAVFLGGLSAHNFYLGKNSKAIIYIILNSIASFCFNVMLSTKDTVKLEYLLFVLPAIILWFIDVIKIIMGVMRDSSGYLLKKL